MSTTSNFLKAILAWRQFVYNKFFATKTYFSELKYYWNLNDIEIFKPTANLTNKYGIC
jgi:hypothetical protein